MDELTNSEKQHKKFSESLLAIVKGQALYSGNSLDSFREITESASNILEVERASIWMYAEDRASMRCMDLYEQTLDRHSQDQIITKADVPNYFSALTEDRVINADDAHRDPRTSEFSEIYLNVHGITSLLDAPIRFGGQTIGVICLEHVGEARHWSIEEITYAGSLGDLISHAVESQKRTKAESELLASEDRYRSLVENLSDILFRTDKQGRIIFISPSVYNLTRYSVEESIGKLVDSSIFEDPKVYSLFIAEVKEKRRISNFEVQLIRKDGVRWWGSLNAHVRVSEDGETLGLEGTVRDISEQKSANEKLRYNAKHDLLTGLINRFEFEERVRAALTNIRTSKDIHAMCFLDLDQFKVVNDTCGHIAGDQLLHELGQLLKSTVRRGDTLARIGGDEFGILMKNCDLDKAHKVANDILYSILDYEFVWEGRVFHIGASIGLVEITEEDENTTELFKKADAACYLAKDRGRSRIHAYHSEDSDLATRHGEMEYVGLIRQALEENRFCLYAQPIISLDDDEHRHYELLIRMLDEEGGIVPPGKFLPAAERYNLIERIDAWVVANACSILAANPAFFVDVDFVSINLSGPSLTNHDFLETILSDFKDTGVSPSKICFEITETVTVSNMSSAIKFIERLKKEGFRFALDDFGSGISSFGYLKRLPVDYLKIDGMFVKDIVDDPIDYAMVKLINEIGHLMGMKTIAEFVESEEIKVLLNDLGVNYGQGYGLGKPALFLDLIAQHKA